MTTAFPLTWPDHIDRHRARETGKFRTSLAGALGNVQQALRGFAADSGRKIDNLVISSNVTLGVTRPADPGVAVWFVWDELQVCIPVDRYTTVEANLQAIFHVLEARRTELRHGTLALVRASFKGFIALPSPSAENAPHWSVVLGVPRDAGRPAIDAAWREKAMARLNAAREQALRETA